MVDGKEVIVSTAEELSQCAALLRESPILGLDTEFVGEETYHPRLCLVQVATPTQLFLIDPLSTGPIDAFWQLLLDPNRLVVVHAGREEVRLCRLWSGFAPAKLFDLQLGAGLLGLSYPMGHGMLVNHFLGVRLSKGETLTEWRRRPLTAEQLQYAFDDVRYLLRVHEKMAGRLAKLNRQEWAEEEFDRLCKLTGPDDPGTEERWRKLKGIGSLDRRKLAIVRALHQWREERAAQVNRPARTVVRDDLLAEIARRNPSRARDLQVVRGLPHRELDAIVAVVQQARDLPVEACPEQTPREIDLPPMQIVSGLAIAVLGDVCARLNLAPSLVCSNNDIRAIVRAHLMGEPVPSDLPLARGWRAKEVVPEIMAVLQGRRAVRIANVRAGAPLEYLDAASEGDS